MDVVAESLGVHEPHPSSTATKTDTPVVELAPATERENGASESGDTGVFDHAEGQAARTLPAPTSLADLQGVHNARDLSSVLPGVILPGKILRSATPAGSSPGDVIFFLERLDIRTVSPVSGHHLQCWPPRTHNRIVATGANSGFSLLIGAGSGPSRGLGGTG